MTTDADEGRRQIEAMQPPKLKVGDNVRLAAGGERVMEVKSLEDYGNSVACSWDEKVLEGQEVLNRHHIESFPVRSLVRVEAE